MFNTETVYFALVVSVVTLAGVLMILRAIKSAQAETLEKVRAMLLDMFKQAHDGYPSAAAVVTPSPAPGPVGEPAPARIATQERAPAPPLTFPPAPGGLPLKPVTLTRDDHPDHTRPTVVAPAPVSDTPPPSTAPTASRPRPVPLETQSARAVKRWTERVDEIRDDATLASASNGPTSDEIRTAFHAEADAKDRRDAAREAHPSPPAEDDGEGQRDTWEEATRMLDRAALPPLAPPAAPTTGRPPPHVPPRRIASTCPTLVGVAPVNTRTAHRIDFIFWSKLTLATKAGAPATHCEGRECNGTQATCPCTCEACGRRRTLYAEATAEIMGSAVTSELAERARETPTPTEPGSPILAQVRRRWAELTAEAQERGKVAQHCHSARCMTEGTAPDICTCKCDGCDLALTLLAQAEREVLGPSSDE